MSNCKGYDSPYLWRSDLCHFKETLLLCGIELEYVTQIVHQVMYTESKQA